jgi:hypothetical protein
MLDLVDQLLVRLNEAVASANEAEKAAETAKDDFVSRSKAVGLLLLEAKRLHPAVKDFEAFLKRVDGLKLSRAYDLLRLAGGRTTDEEIRKANRDRVKKHRASKKKLPKPEPEELSVTSTPVTETAEASAESAKAEKPEAEKTATVSERAFDEFTYACHQWLPKMSEADQQKARLLVSELTSEPKAEAA